MSSYPPFLWEGTPEPVEETETDMGTKPDGTPLDNPEPTETEVEETETESDTESDSDSDTGEVA